MSSDDTKPQHDEENEITEQELDDVSGGFNPQPDPPGLVERWRPPDLPQIMVRKAGGEQQG
jgi:hypothetical protein